MKVLIVGATGFIGKRLTNHLLSKDFQISILTRSAIKARSIFGNNVEIFENNFKDLNCISEIISKNEIIINLAGENIASKTWAKKQKNKILDSRLKIGNYLSEAIKNASEKPKIFIQSSAIGYYGFNLDQPCDESASKGDGFLADVCEQWEDSTKSIETLAVKRIIIRTGIVLDSEEGFLSKIIKPIRFFVGVNLGKGNNYLSWIHIDDFINAIDFLVEQKITGTFNLTSPNPAQAKTINSLIAKNLHRPIWFNLPIIILKKMFGDMTDEVLLSNQQVLPKKLYQTGFKFKYENIKDAIDSLI